MLITCGLMLTTESRVFKLKVFTCQYCNGKFVVMETYPGSLLPVEVGDDYYYTQKDRFESKFHVSHLKHCPKRQLDWEKTKKVFFDRGIEYRLSTEYIEEKPPVDSTDEAGEAKIKKPNIYPLPGTEAYNAIKQEFLNDIERSKNELG